MKSLVKVKYRIGKIFREHQAFVMVTVVLLVLLAVLLRVNTLNDIETDQAYINSESGTIKAVKFDIEAIEEIKALRDSNVATPGTSLPQNRQNPFNE